MPALADTQHRLVRRKAAQEDEFVVFEDVPCFAEHRADDGTVYDRQKLQWICDNQNARIQDTGDYTPIIVQHTPDQHERADPPLIGFAGPFKMGKVGNVRPRWAILGKYRIFKADEETFRKHPRRSVELWVEDDPKDRFFDPISVLGAETPRLDLGMAYSRVNPKRKIARYSAVAPSGTNAFVPALGDDDKKQKHEKESGMALAPEDIHAIIEALKSTAEFQYIQQQMQAAAGSGPAAPGEPVLPGDGLGAEPTMDPAGAADAGTEGLGDEPPVTDDAGMGDAPPPGAEAAAAPPVAPEAAAAPPAGEPAPAPGAPGEEEPLTEKDHVELLRKYSHDGDAEGFDAYYDTLDEDCRKKCMAYAMGEGAELKPEPETKPEPEQGKMNYQKERDEYRDKYAREKRRADDLVSKYERLAADVNEIKARERKAVRYAKLKDLAEDGFNFDVDEELKDCEGMDDAGFERHETRIRTNYTRVPFARNMHHSKPQKYAEAERDAELSNKARDLAQSKGITYAEARAEVHAAAGK